MDPAALLRYKKLLLEKQQELSSIQFDAKTRAAAAGASEGDIVDIANADAEVELQISVHQSNARLLRAIEDALARMRQGNYGVCTSCEKPISKARLEAVPWTHLCRECKEQQRA